MKKGQVAIEYLTTYGWAIILLVIVIGIIATSFSPSFLVSEQCNIDANNLPCNQQVYVEGGDTIVAIRIFNGFGYPIKINEGDIVLKDNNGVSNYQTDVNNQPNNNKIMPGENITIYAHFEGEKQSNSLQSYNIELNYTSCALEINPNCNNQNIEKHYKSGKIIGRVMK